MGTPGTKVHKTKTAQPVHLSSEEIECGMKIHRGRDSMNEHNGYNSQERAVLLAFGLKVRAARIRLGLNQIGFAQRCNLHRTYISNVESGKCNVSLGTLSKLAASLGTTISLLTEGLDLKCTESTSNHSESYDRDCKRRLEPSVAVGVAGPLPQMKN